MTCLCLQSKTFPFSLTHDVNFVLAGGGGGVDKMKGESPRCHGASSKNANAGYGGSQFQGGTAGRGAEEGDNNYSGGGGGGFETSGRSNQNFGGAKGTGGEGGKSFYKGNLSKEQKQRKQEQKRETIYRVIAFVEQSSRSVRL